MGLHPFMRQRHAPIPESEKPQHLAARLAAWRMAVAALAIAAGVMSAPAPAQAQSGRPAMAKVEPAKADGAAIRADLLYHNYCSVCHGDRGDGRSRARGSLVPPPKDFTSPQAIATLNRDHMIAVTAAGKQGTAMVGWSTQLGPKEIEAVVDYVIDTFMKPRTQPGFEAGRALYGRHCASCHGPDGQGALAGSPGGPTRSLATPRAKAELSRERMLAAVTQGVPGTAMTGWASQLSGNDIATVVDYIRVAVMGASPADASGTSAHRGRSDVHGTPGGPSVQSPPGTPPPQGTPGAAPVHGSPGGPPALPGMAGRAAVPAPGHGAGVAHDAAPAPAPKRPAVTADMNAPFPKSLSGQATKGRAFYNANCATCHGVKGDAQGPRAYFIRPRPRNFLTDESRTLYNRPALFAGIANGRLGSEMPAWSQVIGDQQIADVAEYVFQTFIRPTSPVARKP